MCHALNIRLNYLCGRGYSDIFLFIVIHMLLSRDSYKCMPKGYANHVFEINHVFLR